MNSNGERIGIIGGSGGIAVASRRTADAEGAGCVHGGTIRPICAVLLSLAVGSPAFAQSASPAKPLDQSIAGNTQQAAGQLAEINKKLELIIQRMDAMSAKRAPLVVPVNIDCKGACAEEANTLCKRFGYAHGEVIGGQTASISSWICFDSPIP